MGIHDDAFKGVLYSVAGFTKDDINSVGTIDDDGDSLRVTPLAASCRGGHPNVVKLLLENGADPNLVFDEQTAFASVFSSNALSRAQSTIIEELVKNGANVNLACDENGNTPLMAAIIGSQFDHIVRLLITKGALIDGVKNKAGMTVRTLAKVYNKEKLLDKDTDTDGMSKQQIVDLVVGLVQLVVAYANDLTAVNGLKGAVKEAYDMSGIKRSDIVKDIPKPQTASELTASVANYAQEKNLAAFFPADDNKFFEKLAEKATALRNDPSTDLGKPENIGRLTVLSLYEPVLYLDDSGSMKKTDTGKTKTRFELLRELVKRIASIATKIVPDDMSGVELRFLNAAYADRHDADALDKAVKKIMPTGGTQIGTKLRKKVLKPIVYDKIAKKSPANPIPLKRPVLVCIITDGAPTDEGPDKMQEEILECRTKLRNADFEDDAVMFCINQIGQEDEAVEFLNELRGDGRLAQTTHISTDRIDDMFQELNQSERLLEVWLLKLLTKAFFERDGA